jgi:hypothetical protein
MSLYKTFQLVYDGITYSFTFEVTTKTVVVASRFDQMADSWEPIRLDRESDRLQIEVTKAMNRISLQGSTAWHVSLFDAL